MRGVSKSVAALAVGILLGAPAAHAQAEFSLGGGATVPLSTFGDFTKTGFHGLVGVRFAPSSSPVGFQIDGTYQRLKNEDIIPGDRTSQILQGTGNLIYKFKTSEESSFRPYLIGGVGIYNFKQVSGDDVAGPGVGNTGNTGTDFGLNGGAGFDFKTGSVGLFLEGRFHNVFSDGEDAKFIPITLGIRLGGN